ncbi:MAG: type II toxin-antitoxin system RelE/ParE family toxin [gamma proteobacterium symbiont of Taylorina sp.]|nr:type II toxin-antitoxin system RelE/ParE family toxin [gamma proteobacterium symbiont of Taylorina sp.]
MKLRWSLQSLREIKGIVEYIALDNLNAALELGEQIFSVVETTLPNNPHTGRPGRVDGTRELVVHTSYIVVYEITDTIGIITVRHTARPWPEEF